MLPTALGRLTARRRPDPAEQTTSPAAVYGPKCATTWAFPRSAAYLLIPDRVLMSHSARDASPFAPGGAAACGTRIRAAHCRAGPGGSERKRHRSGPHRRTGFHGTVAPRAGQSKHCPEANHPGTGRSWRRCRIQGTCLLRTVVSSMRVALAAAAARDRTPCPRVAAPRCRQGMSAATVPPVTPHPEWGTRAPLSRFLLCIC